MSFSPPSSATDDAPSVISSVLIPVQALIIEACLLAFNMKYRQRAACIVVLSTVVTLVPMALVCRYVLHLNRVTLLVSVLALIGQAVITLTAQLKLLAEKWAPELPLEPTGVIAST